MDYLLAALASVLLAVLTGLLTRRLRKGAPKPKDPNRIGPSLYNAQTALWAALRGEIAEEKHRASLGERANAQLRSTIQAMKVEGIETRAELGRLQRRFNTQWEELDRAKRENLDLRDPSGETADECLISDDDDTRNFRV